MESIENMNSVPSIEKKPTLVELKAKAYDLFVELEQHQANVNAYVEKNVTPLKEELVAVNKEINKGTNETRSSNT